MTHDEAITVAKEFAAARGYTWRGTMWATKRRRFGFFGAPTWHVMSNAGCIGCNVYVDIDDATGRVTHASLGPR